MMKCRAFIENNIFTIDTGLVSRRFHWNNGGISGIDIKAVGGPGWALANEGPDCRIEHNRDIPPEDGTLEIATVSATSKHPEHLSAVVTCRIGPLWIRRVFRIYENCPALACDYYFKGSMPALDHALESDAALRVNLEKPGLAATCRAGELTLDRICPEDRKHLALEVVRFYDVTDYRNTLVERHETLPYRTDAGVAGNLLLIRDHANRSGIFLLKEAPCSDIQIGAGSGDFVHRIGEIRVTGAGVVPDDITPERWTRGYSVVAGIAAGSGEEDILESLRSYQNAARPYRPDRDAMIMLNTWGDRNTYKSISADFVKREISAAALLGITHFQIDDGWQKGLSPVALKTPVERRSAFRAPDYWDVNPEKFPGGFGEIVSYAREKNVELCLWFNPNPMESFRYWRDDARVLTRLHNEYGVRIFKIDGVDIPDKTAETNFRALLDTVLEKTGGRACFNLDITAGRRFGYHYFYEYGNFFLENRYTDWSNYHPHWTLRNLWMLSRYVPAQRLQIEFLNIWRNPDKYSMSDQLAPRKAGFEFAFAVAMPAQPLAWFEASGLPEEAFGLGALVRVYKKHMKELHSSHIWPVGECPNGFNFSGFHAVAPGAGTGYIIVYRQAGARDTARIGLNRIPPETRLKLEALAGDAVSTDATLDDESRLAVRLDKPFSFCFYRYERC